MTKTVRSRFDHEIGQQVEGCTILEKRVVIPPEPSERRLGVYEYVVDAPPAPEKPHGRQKRAAKPAPAPAPAQDSFTRATPGELNRGLIRRVPSR